MFGSRISVVAFPMLVLRLDGSPLVAGLVSCATILPGLLAYIPAGVLVDRWKPLRVLLVSEIGRGIASATIVVMLLFGGSPRIFLLIPAMVAEQILEVFATLAEGRCTSSIVARDDIPRAQAYLQARVHIAVLVGRPVGLFLFVLNPILPFLADALSFACSALSLIAVQEMSDTLRSTPQRLPVARLLDEFRDGFRELECDKHAARTMVLMAGTTLIAQALLMIFLAEAHARQLPATAIGLVLAASGVGGVLGSAVAGRVPRLAQRNWLPVQLCAWSAALAVLVSIGGRSSVAAITVVAIFGFTGAIGNVTFTSYLVQTFPSSMLARVSSIGQVLTISAMGLGPMLGGMAADRHDASKAMGVLLSIAIFMLLISVRSHGFRLGIGRRTAGPAERAALVWPGWVTARLAPWWSSGRREHDVNPCLQASDLGMSFRVVLDRPGPAQSGYPESVIHSSRAGPIPAASAQGLPRGFARRQP
jgi:MFS family permease